MPKQAASPELSQRQAVESQQANGAPSKNDPKALISGEGLRWGQLQYLDKEKNVKKEIKYIFVSEGFTQRTNSVDDILQALRLARPNLILRFAKSLSEKGAQCKAELMTKTYDGLDGNAFLKHVASSQNQASNSSTEKSIEYGRHVMVQKIDLMLKSLSETCAGVGAWMMPDYPYGYNAIAQWVCKDLAPGAICVNATIVDQEMSKSVSSGFEFERSDPSYDLGKRIKECAVPVGFPIVESAKVGLENFFRSVEDATHHVFFECRSDYDAFTQELFMIVPTGFVMFGPKISRGGRESCIETMRNTLPVVLLDYTGTGTKSVIDMVNVLRTRGDPSTLEDQTCRMAVDTWPGGSANALTHVLVVDVLKQSPAEIEAGLARVLSSIYEFVPDLSMRSKEHQALRYGWGLKGVMNTNASSAFRLAVGMRYSIALLTFASILLTSAYALVHDSDKNEEEVERITLCGIKISQLFYGATIVMPLVVAGLITIETQHNPISRFTSFNLASKQAESEIYFYRCRIGRYRPPLNAGRARGSERIRKCFIQAIQGILRQLEPALGNEYMTDFVESPEEYPSNFLQTQRQMYGLNGGGSRLLDWTMSGGRPGPSYSAVREKERLLDGHVDIETVSEVDDGYAVMSADSYLQERLLVQVNTASANARRMSRNYHTMTVLIVVITTSSAAFAGFKLQYWVPVVLGLGNMFKNLVEFHSHAPRIKACNALIMELHRVYGWWNSLSVFEQRMPVNKERLVEITENAILAESGSAASSMRTAEEERLKSAKNEDEDNEEEKKTTNKT